MANTPANPDAADETGVGSDHGSTTGTPRWVKVFGIIALVVALVFVVLLLTGRGGGHGPGRHISSDDRLEGHTPPPGVTRGDQQP